MTKHKYIQIPEIEPLTTTQEAFFDMWESFPLHVLYGTAGTGKTFIALYKGLQEVIMNRYRHNYHQVVIFRSAVSGRDIGALPGDEDEKAMVYQYPYMAICSSIFGKGDSYQRLIEQGSLQFSLTSYIRGVTYDNTILIVDEMQNLSYQELYTIMTRVGENSKIVFCGDFKQTDLKDSGFNKFLSVLEKMKEASFYKFTTDDIVRSDLVRKFIIAEEHNERETL